ncbi:hypothetical protein BS47DRAFT_1368524 [Hydnum rufescens UP504]|uniref:Uncharacterized protein n=1 Tax=Hydnum rufescens UP504 TaxID=1448309 RepID=A0A9P6AFK3_9AGAM|nr:hypothetical protein BS47DRAFT_1368524 [Hydnum rufescens UP504]
MTMQYDEDASDGDRLIKWLNNTTDITPHRTTPAEVGVVLHKNECQTKPRNEDTQHRTMEPPRQTTHLLRQVNESAPDNPQTHLSPIRKPNRGRHMTMVWYYKALTLNEDL